MVKRATGNNPVKIVPRQGNEDIPITQDERLRRKIQGTLEYYRNHPYSEDEFQFKLSKVLCQVERTDTGNAIRLAARYGHLVHYVPEPDKWYIWDGKRWVIDAEFQIVAYAKKVSAYVNMEKDCIPLPTDEQGNPLMLPVLSPLDKPTPDQQAIIDRFTEYERQAKELKQWAIQSRSKVRLQAMIELLKDEPGVTVAKARFDADDYLVNCRNGVFDLKTGELSMHKPEYLMTRQANVDMFPGATSPAWNTFIQKVTKQRQGIATFLQKLAGMGLCGERFDDIFTVFHGNGSNGKTVFQEVLRDLLGEYADLAPSEMFLEKKSDAGYNDIAGLDGIRFLFKDETKQGRRLDESTVKEMTGGGGKKARFLFKEFFTFIPKFTPILSTNHKPIITGNDNGIWRRVKLVPWEHNFDVDPERRSKPEVLASLKKEYPGIFLWCYQGLRMVLQDMEAHGSLQVPSEVANATQQYREQSDVIGAILADFFVIDGLSTVSKGEAYKVYREAMEEAGSHPMNNNNFSEELQNRGFESKRGTGGIRQWIGLRLRTPDDVTRQEPEPQVSSNGHRAEADAVKFVTVIED